MSASHFDTNAHIDSIVTRAVPSTARAMGFIAIGIGLLSMVYGFFIAGHAAWTWGAFLVALVYIMALSQGGIMLAVILTLTKAHWGRPVKRIAEVFGLFLPITYLLLVVFLLFGNGLYPWNPDTFVEPFVGNPVPLAPHSELAISSKEFWLSKWFFIGRQLLALGLLFTLGLLYVRNGIRPDLIAAKARLGDKAPSWWNWFTGSAKDVDSMVATGEKNQMVLATIIAPLYAMVFSLMAYDLMMSLSPWWYANMFGAWTFMSSIWVTFAAVGMYSVLSRDWLGIGGLVTRNVTHDIGKLCLALCMFWAYTTFAQLLPIWYANMPEETDFLLVRLFLPQWSWLAQTVGVMCFLMPFTVLVSRGVKKIKWPFVGITAVIMTGVFLERTLVVMPSIYFGDEFPTSYFVLISLGIWIGFLGLFFTFVTSVLSKLPAVGITDPRLTEHPWDVHVHDLDHANASH